MKKLKTKPKLPKDKIKIVYIERTTDYHDFSYRGCSIEHRQRLDIGPIYVNAAICNLCGWFVRSRNRHDFVTCRCGALSVDGGSWYCKRTGNHKDYTDVIELFDEVDKEKEFH